MAAIGAYRPHFYRLGLMLDRLRHHVIGKAEII